MISLPNKFETRYFVYTQMFRKGSKALWKRESKLSTYIHYELVTINHYPGRQNTRNLSKIKEYYPYYPEKVTYTEEEALILFQQMVQTL